MDTGETMAKTTTTTIETFTLSDAHRDIDRSEARTQQRPIDKIDAENVSINALDRRHVNNNDSSNESMGRLSSAGSTNSAAAPVDVDHASTTKNKRKNFQPRSTAAADEDAAKDLPAESVPSAPSAAFESTETQISATPSGTNNTAFNAIKELLNVYGLSMSPNDIVDAFNRTLEMDAIKELAKSREYCRICVSRFLLIGPLSVIRNADRIRDEEPKKTAQREGKSNPNTHNAKRCEHFFSLDE